MRITIDMDVEENSVVSRCERVSAMLAHLLSVQIRSGGVGLEAGVYTTEMERYGVGVDTYAIVTIHNPPEAH